MKKIILIVAAALACASAFAQNPDQNDPHLKDWAEFYRYAPANAAITDANRPRVVFMGDSITEFWQVRHGDYFTSHNYACRGLSAQVPAQMLARFQRDVVDVHPDVVVILGGINDIAQNNGSISNENIVSEIKSMVELARYNGIEPIICSVLPCARFFWRRDMQPAPLVVELNKVLKAYAESAGVTYVDYWTAMATPEGALPAEYSQDGCHPVEKGYEVMESIVDPVINSVLAKISSK